MNNKLKYKFTKISNNHGRLRDDEILCYSCSKIKIGLPVYLTAPPRDDGNIRSINTNNIKSLIKVNDKITEVTTESGSVYRVEELP